MVERKSSADCFRITDYPEVMPRNNLSTTWARSQLLGSLRLAIEELLPDTQRGEAAQNPLRR
jgi:hypothetical protein